VSLDLSAAVEAAARANYERHYRTGRAWNALDDQWLLSARAIVRPIVEAAAPLVEAAVRAQVAAEIRARIGAEPLLMHVTDWVDGMETAEAIARDGRP